MSDFDEAQHARDAGGKFSSTGASKLTAGRKVSKKVDTDSVKAINRWTKIRTEGRAERTRKFENFVAEKTPKPPKGAEWVGDETVPHDDQTAAKYIEPPIDDPTSPVKDPIRKELHDAIKKHFIGSNSMPKAGQQPVAIIMMGGSGSGKSSLLRDKDKSEFVHVDPDGIKEKLPEYRDGVSLKQRNAAALVHEESSHIAKNLRNEAMVAGRNIIMDGTGANAKTYGRFIEDLKERGYHVSVLFSHLPYEKAAPRIAARAEDSGRHVVEAAAKENHKSVPANWEKLARLAHDATMYSTDVPEGEKNKRVWDIAGGKDELLHDEAFIENFRYRYGRSKD